MKKQETPYQPPFSHRFIAGGIAGICEILVMYPTDVVKTRAQLAIGSHKENMFKAMGKILKEEGVLRMYRGILPPIFVEAPKRAIKFSANETYKPFFMKNGKLSNIGAISAGVAAGMTEAFVVVPFELVKIRLQDKNNIGRYKSTLDCCAQILKHEGPFAFFKGLEATLFRHAFWNGGYFGSIPFIKRFLAKFSKKDTPNPTWNNFVAGTIGGTIGTILNTPFDVVKSRIQNASENTKYRWTVPSLVTIFKEEGFTALYKGFVPKVVRLGPGGGILLVVFEIVSKFLRERSHKK